MFKSPLWRNLGVRALDLLYPPSCAICEIALSEGRSLCPTCDENLPRLSEPFCKCCGEEFPGKIDAAFACPNCSTLKFAFEFARPAMVRDDATLAMIHRLKYGREIHLAKELGRLAASSFQDPRLEAALAEKWPLVPVPLHRGRLQHRHFNQAQEIANGLAKVVNLPILRALQRMRATHHQTALTRKQRLENLKGAFSLTREGTLWANQKPLGVVLIDDVFTTGATINECAKLLRRAGVKRVCAVTVMRG